MNGKQFASMIAAEHGVTWDDLIGPSRKSPVILARREAVWALRQMIRDGKPRYTFPFLARMFNRHHSTIVSLCQSFDRHGVRQDVAA